MAFEEREILNSLRDKHSSCPPLPSTAMSPAGRWGGVR